MADENNLSAESIATEKLIEDAVAKVTEEMKKKMEKQELEIAT